MTSNGTPHPGLPSTESDRQLGRDDDPSRTTASRTARPLDGRINVGDARMRAQSERMWRLPQVPRHGMVTRSSSLEPLHFVGMTGGVSFRPQSRLTPAAEHGAAGTWEQQIEWDEFVFPQTGIHLPPEQAVQHQTAPESPQSPEMDRGMLQREAERLRRLDVKAEAEMDGSDDYQWGNMYGEFTPSRDRATVRISGGADEMTLPLGRDGTTREEEATEGEPKDMANPATEGGPEARGHPVEDGASATNRVGSDHGGEQNDSGRKNGERDETARPESRETGTEESTEAEDRVTDHEKSSTEKRRQEQPPAPQVGEDEDAWETRWAFLSQSDAIVTADANLMGVAHGPSVLPGDYLRTESTGAVGRFTYPLRLREWALDVLFVYGDRGTDPQ